ncbi:hypothetical protein U9M48_029967 [Paspalum notatum var. saurae]|uniref:Cell cycle checkpoint protein RAD1 n=1 Tax=Paspalum notatum var. saurae TaxID=547442 RepID=A0AAQ3X2T6_PASNO
MSSPPPARDDDAPDLVCQIDCVQGMVDALSSVRWKRHQDALMELSQHGIVLTVEESGCLQAKVFLKRELFVEYDYAGDGRQRFGLSLGLLVDCLNIFSTPGQASTVEIRYPGPDMELLLKSVGSPDSCLYAEIRTRIPDTVSWDYHFEHDGNTPVTFTVKSAILKETVDDLEWPGSSIQIRMQPDPPTVIFRGEGHGDLQIDLPYYANTDLLIVFQCDREVSYRYKYKFLRATTSNIPATAVKENCRTKVTIGRGGMLKIQHLVSLARPGMPYFRNIGGGTEQTSRIAHIEFFVKPEEDDNDA